ncbi:MULTISPECIES: nucleotidyltransferase family protein [Arthrobacter]|uniref:Nucleotidyltransferase family protein n=2 Tax=Arthrobacter TaxID=1663 RepID=A0ABU9KLC6_9MICC|nr:nucleotidyltransferase family protein [Arthrobacter sp. YJM1]MDP5227711.1 nucleotidyltransferase family protein [Arthrobacter sp. YJM1]
MKITHGERIRLAHAVFQALADRHGVDVLHIKGYATQRRLYTPNRVSSDVDLLVRPAHVPILIGALKDAGWDTIASFESGSVFRHAMTFWHPDFGHMDLHRLFPGVGLPPEEFFELLWASRATTTIAGWPCQVPSARYQALIVLLHAGRDEGRGSSDIEHLRGELSPEEWEDVHTLAVQTRSELGWASAAGQLEAWARHPEHDLWMIMSQGGSSLSLLRARVKAAQGPARKAAVLKALFVVNKDHLRNRLLREPTRQDVREEWKRRFRSLRRR